MKIGAIFYVNGHMDLEEFSKAIECQYGFPVNRELIRHWYGRAVPFKLSDGTWSGRGHVITAQRGPGAKKFTVVDLGPAVKMKSKPVISRENIDFEKEGISEDLMRKIIAEIGEKMKIWINEAVENVREDGSFPTSY